MRFSELLQECRGNAAPSEERKLLMKTGWATARYGLINLQLSDCDGSMVIYIACLFKERNVSNEKMFSLIIIIVA